jgi:hypothetical protein
MFGLFDILVWDNPDVDSTKPHRYFYRFKSRIRSSPSSIEEKGRSAETGQKQTILHYNEGATFIASTNLQVDVQIARQMLDIMTLGYLPPNIEYDRIAEYWTDTNLFNGIGLDNISQTSIEMMVATLCRDKEDLSKPFRHRLRDKASTDKTGWKMINIRLLPRYSDLFASLISGNPRGNIVSVISQQKQGKQQKESPIEKAII